MHGDRRRDGDRARRSPRAYPLAGAQSHTVSIGVYNFENQETIYLNTQTGPYDQYLTNITWSPDGKYIYISWVNREQNVMQLRKYNAENGTLEKTLYEVSN